MTAEVSDAEIKRDGVRRMDVKRVGRVRDEQLAPTTREDPQRGCPVRALDAGEGVGAVRDVRDP